MQIVLMLILVWLAVGVWLVASTQSRGLFADVLFALLWPVYIYTDWRAGRL